MVSKGVARNFALRAEDVSAVHTKANPLRVILADSQAIFRVGISKILSAAPDICVVAEVENLPQTLQAVSSTPADVLLFETALSPAPAESIAELLHRAPNLRLIALVSDLAEAETVEFLRRGVQGLIARAIDPELLVRCVRKVAAGETWLDKRAVNWVIKAFRNQAAELKSANPRQRLSKKELLIIAGVTRGLRNKDIAQQIGTTEQVVKNYLRKIYFKLGINDRLELALFTVHRRLLESGELTDELISMANDSVETPEQTFAPDTSTGDPVKAATKSRPFVT